MPRIESDVNRFRQIVRGKVREERKKHLGKTELFGKQGGHVVSIPITQAASPKLHHTGGRRRPARAKRRRRPSGRPARRHILEAEFSVEELATMLGEALSLRIQPKGTDELNSVSGRYTGSPPPAPNRSPLKRLPPGAEAPDRLRTYDPTNPRVRCSAPIGSTDSEAASPPEGERGDVYAADVSGSMGDEQKDRAHGELLAGRVDPQPLPGRAHGLHRSRRRRKEVDREIFFTLRSLGTVISSAYEPPRESSRSVSATDWNLYLFHFTDGENYPVRTGQVGGPARGEAVPASICSGMPGRGVGDARRFHRRPALALR
jgi:hypothetical protein